YSNNIFSKYFVLFYFYLIVYLEDAEVKIEVLFKPLECAQKSKKGDLMNVHYDGYLLDGTQFVCSRSPLWMVVGVGQVIRGLDSGMLDMCPGEKRKITVPLSWRSARRGKVNKQISGLIKLIQSHPVSGPRSMEAFSDMDQNKDRKLTKDEVKQYLKEDYTKVGNPRDDAFYQRIMEDIFMKNDHNKDGLISAKEYNVYEHDEL
uniref:peptidylprolyl isomerase n=1 Tax=Neogobius melanostomus TaxID=47308 RepID=A0A8C6TC00_9GOBI